MGQISIVPWFAAALLCDGRAIGASTVAEAIIDVAEGRRSVRRRREHRSSASHGRRWCSDNSGTFENELECACKFAKPQLFHPTVGDADLIQEHLEFRRTARE